MRVLGYGVLTFAVTGLIGPLIRLATWPPSRFEAANSAEAEHFIYNLVLDLWPALAVLAHGFLGVTGFFNRHVIYTICANVGLFALFGLLVSPFAHRDSGLVAGYAIACGVLAIHGLWLAGFSPSSTQLLALIVAMTIVAVPFWLVRLAVRRRR
jgi:hypothetical protein